MRRLGVIALALVAAASCTSQARHPAAGPPASVTVPAPASSDELARGHWTQLPSPPIEARLNADVTWTGRLLLVWGGGSGKVEDGADFDPGTGQWRTLPPSPLGVRAGELAVWTGRVWVLWGGLSNPTGTPTGPELASGAAYDPVARTWKRTAPAPLSGRLRAAGVWTGREVLVLGGDSAKADGAAYDPAADRWRTLAPFPAVKGHDPTGSYALSWTGTRLLAWQAWIHLDNPNSGRSSYQSGSDLASYDPSTDRWRPVSAAPGAPAGVSSPLWTGSQVFVPSTHAPTPYLNDTSDNVDHLYDLDANRWKAVPSLSPSGYTAVWTGESAVEVVTPAPAAPGTPYAAPFTQLAAWDPGSDHWTSLPRAPQAATLPLPVWTGTDLVYWCAMSTNVTGLPGWSFGR